MGPKTPLPTWSATNFSHGFIADYKPFTSVDGEGIRNAVYVSGCLFSCPGCYNKAAQSFRYGKPLDQALLDQIEADLAQPYVAGLSLLGGEPFLNVGTCLQIIERVKPLLATGKTIWCWTGYTLEQLLEGSDKQKELLSYVDVLIDGPYVEKLADKKLEYRGSSNQRIHYLAKI